MTSPSPPPSTDSDGFEVDPALAASMGFTSFGAAPRPAKRMKMSGGRGQNHNTGRGAQSTGANNVQVGERRRPVEPSQAAGLTEQKRENPEEIDLDMDDDDEELGEEKTQDVVEGAQRDTSTAKNAKLETDTGSASSSAATSKQKGKAPAPASGLAAFLARGQKIKPPQAPAPVPPAEQSSEISTDAGTGSIELPLHSTSNAPPAPLPPPPPYVLPERLEDLTHADLAILRRGVRDERGDLAIFMPSFVEDPWEGQGDGKTFRSVGKA